MTIRYDLHNNVDVVVAKNPTDISSSTTTAGNIIDTKGFRTIEFVLYTGTRTDGTYTPLIEEGDDSGLSDAAAVADANLQGTEADAAISASNAAKRVGYIVGNKRYVRLSVVSATVTTGCTAVGAIAIKGGAELAPV
jgi:hypothetical protein